MAKGGDPAAAERKRLEKKQQQKNKAQRAEAAKLATVKKDTRSLEKDVKELEAKAQKGPLSKAEREELDKLRAELVKIRSAKDAYVEAHTEHRKFIYPHNQEDKKKENEGNENNSAGRMKAIGALLGKNGLPKHPERSVYFHPLLNPTGAAPPGMPYREKLPHEWPGASAEKLDGAQGDDGIAMPSSPRPAQAEDEGHDSSDTDSGLEDVEMPDGPPPPKPPTGPRSMHVQQQGPTWPPGAPSNGPGFYPKHIPPPGYGLPGVYLGPPPSLQAGMMPPPPPFQHQQFPPGGFGRGRERGGAQAQLHGRGHGHGPGDGPGRGMGPGRDLSGSGVAGTSVNPEASSSLSATTISAAPQLRDLKREVTEFVPAAIRKKQATDKARAKMGLPPAQVSSAPGVDEGQGRSSSSSSGGLLEKLKPQLEGSARGPGPSAAGAKDRGASADDYQKFLDSVGDLL
ncbi:hypothetical protein K437DRAFT_256645 [Tilletiaria anomala UBC 951]|uniref:Wbp11/ELF5/Saf1 N-terminal domain-containing protein n=1 Tax=Tilletiaria anomala (strain ATCC 24038 / CBS 436.72 / UBC 951) TaxID=1037660 RepID=A0A066VUZ6_TILAU|nr:uncharacterized protein K437DRAFT_256645 [Tilletiaria anomala UBC 951]KDN45301.1 hypothetical protein K437DRAFT_256645 [Tilletiaria anomala UBC 951]